MKKILFFAILILLCNYKNVNAQDSIVIELSYNNVKPNDTVMFHLDDKQRDYAKKVDKDFIFIKLNDIPVSITEQFKINGTYDGVKKDNFLTFDITREINSMVNIPKQSSAPLTIKNLTNTLEVGAMIITWNPFQSAVTKEVAEKKSLKNKQEIISSFKKNSIFDHPYTYKKNRVDLFFEENGKLLNSLPVNIDQNDIFQFHIVCPEDDEDKYRINTIEGAYSPVDLAIVPYIKPSIVKANATEEEEYNEIKYMEVIKPAGPFTSDNFTFQIAYDSINGKTYNGPVYSVKINKLYHVGVGVSIVKTGLENPDFRVAPLGNGTSTIESYNNGSRTLFTFNVIWYWSILQQNSKGSAITNGRDILKDEPTWSKNRIFPTVGVSLDDKFSENFFAGIVYEFARGGSLIAGVHYGRVQELSDDTFILNETPFEGTNDDIRINNVYKPAFFFGVNVDTRIFNTLFGKGQ